MRVREVGGRGRSDMGRERTEGGKGKRMRKFSLTTNPNPLTRRETLQEFKKQALPKPKAGFYD